MVKPVFHFNRIVFHCFVNTQAELMILTQGIEYATFRYDTAEVENGLKPQSRGIKL